LILQSGEIKSFTYYFINLVHNILAKCNQNKTAAEDGHKFNNWR